MRKKSAVKVPAKKESSTCTGSSTGKGSSTATDSSSVGTDPPMGNGTSMGTASSIGKSSTGTESPMRRQSPMSRQSPMRRESPMRTESPMGKGSTSVQSATTASPIQKITTKTSASSGTVDSDSEYQSTMETNMSFDVSRYDMDDIQSLPKPLQHPAHRQIPPRSETRTEHIRGADGSISTVTTISYESNQTNASAGSASGMTSDAASGMASSAPSGMTSGALSGTSAATTTGTESCGPRRMRQSASVELAAKNSVFYPLLLRVNKKETAVTTKLSGTHLSTPVLIVQKIVKTEQQSSEFQLVTSLRTPFECTRAVPPHMVLRSQHEYILSAPVKNILLEVAPGTQKIKSGRLDRKLSGAALMLPPEGPKIAELLEPQWETVTYDIAIGKHIAVPYAIPAISPRRMRIVVAQKNTARKVDSKTLYKKPTMETILTWKAAEKNQLKLSTVEVSDPRLVRVVKLEQVDQSPQLIASFEAMVETTETVTHEVKGNGKEKSRGGNKKEQKRKKEHKLIEHWTDKTVITSKNVKR